MNDTYFIMNFLDETPEIGVSAESSDAAHLTFLAHVNTPERYKGALLSEFYAVADSTSPFALTVGESDTFGATGQFTVLTVNDAAQKAAHLHQALLSAISAIRGIELGKPGYSGAHFRPHITLGGGVAAEDFVTDDVFLVNEITLVRHIGGIGVGAVEVVGSAALAS